MSSSIAGQLMKSSWPSQILQPLIVQPPTMDMVEHAYFYDTAWRRVGKAGKRLRLATLWIRVGGSRLKAGKIEAGRRLQTFQKRYFTSIYSYVGALIATANIEHIAKLIITLHKRLYSLKIPGDSRTCITLHLNTPEYIKTGKTRVNLSC